MEPGPAASSLPWVRVPAPDASMLSVHLSMGWGGGGHMDRSMRSPQQGTVPVRRLSAKGLPPPVRSSREGREEAEGSAVSAAFQEAALRFTPRTSPGERGLDASNGADRQTDEETHPLTLTKGPSLRERWFRFRSRDLPPADLPPRVRRVCVPPVEEGGGGSRGSTGSQRFGRTALTAVPTATGAAAGGRDLVPTGWRGSPHQERRGCGRTPPEERGDSESFQGRENTCPSEEQASGPSRPSSEHAEPRERGPGVPGSTPPTPDPGPPKPSPRQGPGCADHAVSQVLSLSGSRRGGWHGPGIVSWT